MASPSSICANCTPGHDGCKEIGRFSCKNCRLVNYCGRECQKAHWAIHKIDCRSPLGKDGWQPAWVHERRQPSFVVSDNEPQFFGMNKYLWGNVPALDVLKLDANEGVNYNRDLSLLFAASGDIRNVAKTIAELPESYKRSVHVVINDREFDVVARNIIILLIALVVEDPNEAAECIIHVWYSALLRESDMAILRHRIRPLIVDLCNKSIKKPSNALLGKTWTFGKHSLRVVLRKVAWNRLVCYLDPVLGLTVERAHKVRTGVTMSEHRKDRLERGIFASKPFYRVALVKFREDGLLLPFGAPRSEFTVPNPTFFQNNGYWPMLDASDPLSGWPINDMMNTPYGPANADIYGKLYCLLRSTLKAFIARLSASKITLEHLHVDAMELPRYIHNRAPFSRIDVSNIADRGYVGLRYTLGAMLPLLQDNHVNPHATLIALFINAVGETENRQDVAREYTAATRVVKRLMPHFPAHIRLSHTTFAYDAKLMVLENTHSQFMFHDQVFDRYLSSNDADNLAILFRAAIKQVHTIVQTWPFTVTTTPVTPEAQEVFDRMLGSNHTGKERYVEWQRRP
ncbi:hypothetical protein N3K66_000295 [Trichothecium roseum]|uniref:Uncharacterized protein n=1 Tax=Trichothecium roseum TaxID=47278 RepID=A0ACC0VBH9_9HYPO|nr:hypothetical protein N3K66_000295 [Trichothecium roseum]